MEINELPQLSCARQLTFEPVVLRTADREIQIAIESDEQRITVDKGVIELGVRAVLRQVESIDVGGPAVGGNVVVAS